VLITIYVTVRLDMTILDPISIGHIMRANMIMNMPAVIVCVMPVAHRVRKSPDSRLGDLSDLETTNEI